MIIIKQLSSISNCYLHLFTLTDSLDSSIVDRPETTTSSTSPDPLVVRAFRPPPPLSTPTSATVGVAANMSNISDSKNVIYDNNNSSISSIIVSTKNNSNEIVTALLILN